MPRCIEINRNRGSQFQTPFNSLHTVKEPNVYHHNLPQNSYSITSWKLYACPDNSSKV